MLTWCGGCVRETRTPVAPNRWVPSHATHVQVQTVSLGEVPNNGLLLPVVSPDGQWIASPEIRGAKPIDPESLFTGKGLETMSLLVRKVQPGSTVRRICPEGAAWPAWSADSRQLVFVVHRRDGRCDLGIYDVATGVVRRKTAPLVGMITPALSPSGKQVAVAGVAVGAGAPGLHVLDLETGELKSCPTGETGARVFFPQWTADGRIVFVLAVGGRTWIAQWGPGKFGPEKLHEIRVSPSLTGMYQSFAGLGRPLSPDDRGFSYYDTGADRVVLVDLRDGRRTELKTKTRFGCWMGPGRFVAATDREMLIFAPGDEPAGARSARIMRGVWLPRQCVRGADELIVCTRGTHRRAFELVRMKVDWVR